MTNSKISKLLEKIANIDVDSLSISESYDLLRALKNDSKEIFKKWDTI